MWSRELEQCGLRIYNANVKELRDAPGSEYFAFLSQKAHESASNRARIDVAEARMRGEIGESEKNGRTRQEISRIDADIAVLETNARARKPKLMPNLRPSRPELAARRQAEMRDAELQKGVEQKKAGTEPNVFEPQTSPDQRSIVRSHTREQMQNITQMSNAQMPLCTPNPKTPRLSPSERPMRPRPHSSVKVKEADAAS